MGEHAAWGARRAGAFGEAHVPPAAVRDAVPLGLDDAIPWVSYDDDGVSRADYAYGYTQALLDGVCRPITFLPYDGEMEWVARGRRRDARASRPCSRRPRPRAGCAPRSTPRATGWASVLRDADAQLSEVRAAGHADAGGLVVASDKEPRAHPRRRGSRGSPASGPRS